MLEQEREIIPVSLIRVVVHDAYAIFE
ncbi:hypothetical protein TcasGA2_TC010756 [Tribolium castaneum]|uniref:Uncharacterized protein n=1 Tax=Tribolium castaneum TaxID=7070 RepID=D6W7U9_TRICA|nr:hypothetical protein TcasGA2_TC010756 [Tribolium castaneum]